MSVVDHNIDIVCIQEHRYHHSKVDIKYHDTGKGWTFVTTSAWKNSVNTIIGSMGTFLGPWTLKSHNSIKKIQPRMMVAMFNGNPSITIISCYSPTSASDETDLDTFYNELSSLVHSIPKQCSNHQWRHECTNRNVKYLMDFTLENELTCLNWF